MNILSLCCALNKTYFGFLYNNEVFSEIIESDVNYHSLYLIDKINKIKDEKSIDFKKLNFICVNCGPGSFTGIRVAMSIAKVLASELNIPLVGLNTAEILLEAYKKDVLIMDARRDMFFVGDKNKIELVLKDKVLSLIQNKTIVADKSAKNIFQNALCYEDENEDLSKIMLKLAQDKYINTSNKEEFNFQNIQANYIQTPPVF